MSFVLIYIFFLKNQSHFSVFGIEKMHQGALHFLWEGEFISSFNLNARTHLSSGANTSSGKGLCLSLNRGSGTYQLCDLSNDI